MIRVVGLGGQARSQGLRSRLRRRRPAVLEEGIMEPVPNPALETVPFRAREVDPDIIAEATLHGVDAPLRFVVLNGISNTKGGGVVT